MSALVDKNFETKLGAAISVSKEKANPLELPDVPYVGLEHIEKNTGFINGFETAATVRSTKSVFRRGDLLYGKLRPYLNKVWIAEFDGICSTDILVYPKSETVDNHFLKYRFMSRDFVNYAATNSNGVNLPRVNAKVLSEFPLWLPPLDEQRRIVAEIEKQFTRLDAGVAALQRVQLKLKRYRASVLKSACEGRLVPTESELAEVEAASRRLSSKTTKSRDGSSTYEPAKVLLQRILTERREKWNGRGKYKEPTTPDIVNLPELPEGWVWAKLEQLAWSSSYGTSAKCSYDNSGSPVLRIPNIAGGRIDLSDVKFAGAKESIKDGNELTPGDLLIIRTNGSRNLIGRSAVVQQEFAQPTNYASYLIRFRLIPEPNLFTWIATIWDSGFLRTWIEGRAATSAGQHNISMTVLNDLPIPLPPFAEQERIVAEAERRLSVVDEFEATVTANLQRATRLRQSILQQAFSGGI